MDKEDVHILFQGISIIISLIGFLVIIFKGGRYTGATDAKIATLIENQSQVKSDLDVHRKEDQKIQSDIIDRLNDMRVVLAAARLKAE